MGPEISNFSHTIPNYCRHFVQIIARKSMTGRGGRLPQCLFQRYKRFSFLFNFQRKQYEIHRFLSLTTLSSSVCLFQRDRRQGFDTERKSRVNETLKVITNIKEIQFRDRIKGFETLDFGRNPIHTVYYFVGHNSWICVSRKISSVSSKRAVVHCCTQWIYLLNEPSPKLTRDSVTLQR